MGLLDFVRPEGWLSGHVTIHGIPTNFGIVVNLLVRRGKRIEETAPSNAQLYEVICVKEREHPDAWPLHFAIARPRGIYHVGLSCIVFQDRGGKLYAQVERFFPIPKPQPTGAREADAIRMSAQWPKTPVEQLGSYGTVCPRESSKPK